MNYFYMKDFALLCWWIVSVAIIGTIHHHHHISNTTVLAFPILQPPPQRNIIPQQRRRHRRSPQSWSSSFSFGTGPKIRCAVIPTPYFAENGDNNNSNNNNSAKSDTTKASSMPITFSDANRNSNDTEKEMSSTTSTSTTTTTTTTTAKSIFHTIDEWAQQLKVAALQSNAKAAIVTTASGTRRWSKYRYYIQACLYYTLFLTYRAYRGLFIISPAVFRETFRKLQNAIEETPFEDTTTGSTSTSSTENNDTTTTTTGTADTPPPMPIRTRMTISIMAAFVLGTYVVGGAIRVVTAMVQSMGNGSGIVPSLQQAIQLQERNEWTLLQKSTATTTTTRTNTITPSRPVNGATTTTATPSSSTAAADTPDTTNDSNRFAP